MRRLPPLHEVAGMAGIELSNYLGSVTNGEGGALVRQDAPPIEIDDEDLVEIPPRLPAATS